MRRIERFDIYLKTKGLNDNIVTNDLGLSVGTIGKSRKEGRDLSDRVIELILNFYTDLSKVWLLTGEGEMLVDVPNQQCEDVEEVQAEDIVLPFVNKELATRPNLNISRMVEERSHELDVFPVHKIFGGARYAQTVITMAMAPRYLPGDYLIIGRSEDNVLSGKPYLVDTERYGTMFRFVHIEENGYRLEAHNPKFKDVIVPFDKVYTISRVQSAIITNISLSADFNLAELVRNRDAQISQLTDAHSTIISSTNDLIASQNKLIEELHLQNGRIDKERERTERERERTDKLIDKILRE